MKLKRAIDLFDNKILTYMQKEDVFQTMKDIQLNKYIPKERVMEIMSTECIPKGTILTVISINADSTNVNAVMTDRKDVKYIFTTCDFMALRKIN